MSLNITEQQYRVVKQSLQTKFIKLQLLNYNFQTVDELSGVAIGGEVSVDANSDIRRTANLSIVVTDSSFAIQPGGKIFLDKYIRIFVGIKDTIQNEIVWTNCGLYIIDAPKYIYNSSTNTLTICLLDLMAKLSGARNGYIKGFPVKIKAGENIRKAIIETLKLGGVNKYIVEEAPAPGVIPYDIDIGQGATIYNILSAIKEIYPGFEMYFDVDGVFHYKPIPNGINDPIYVDDDIWNSVVIEEAIEVDFQNVKNSIEVYGRLHDPEYFSKESVVENSTIKLKIDNVLEYSDNIIYGFTLENNPKYQSASLQINELNSYPITLDDGKTPAVIPESDGKEFYCVQFKGTYWNWLGHLQAYGFAEDTNKQSPFYIYGPVGIIRLPLFDGEYSNCLTDNLAQQRAEYELWKHTNLNNLLTMTTIPIPWLDVNILVERTFAQSKERSKYIIKTLNFGLSFDSTETITMMKFYPEGVM